MPGLSSARLLAVWKNIISLFTNLVSRPTAPSKASSIEGTAAFTFEGETYQTWYKVFGDLTNSDHIPLVVLHGGPGLSHDYLLPISDLSASRPVIFYDQIGNSRSTHLDSKPASFWTIDLFISELVNLITHLGIQDNFDIIGHSWGGVLGAELEVRRHPPGMKHLILTDSLAAMSLWVQSTMQLASGFPSMVQGGLAAGFSDVPKYRAALAQFHAVHGCTVKPPPRELNYSFDQLFNNPTVSLAMSGGALQDWTIIDRLHLIRVQTLVINGRADIAQDFVVAPFFKNIPAVKWITFENSSHVPMWEERERYMKVVDEFLVL